MYEYELSERKKLILQAIVESHIRYGEPVGSKTLTENQQLTCSSATIRNEMAELEALGFLEQPHASAGRVPIIASRRASIPSPVVVLVAITLHFVASVMRAKSASRLAILST